MFGLEKYSDIFGKPKTGVHKFRFMNLAVVDCLATIIGGLAIAYIFKLNRIYVILALFILGIILHALFSVRTTIDKMLM